MKRKIIQLAPKTKVITIPNEFTINNKLNKGDFLDVEIVNNSLIITNTNNNKSEILLDLTSLSEDLIWRHLITSYRKGTDIIKIKHNNKDLKIIQNLIKDLMGMAIVKQNKELIIVKDLFNKHDINIKDTIDRVFKLLIEESEETLQALKDNDKTSLKNIDLLDFNINRFTNLYLRVLNKYSFQEEKMLSLYKIISTLEEIGDEYRRIANVNLRLKNINISKNILNYFSEVNLLLKEYYSLFNKYDKEKIITFYEKEDLLLENLKKNYNKRSSNEIQILSGLDTILHLIKSLIEENFVLSL